MSDSPEGAVADPVWYELPAKGNNITITAAKDLVLTLTVTGSPDETFVFDVGKRMLEYPLGAPAVPAVVVPQPTPEETTLPGPVEETVVPASP